MDHLHRSNPSHDIYGVGRFKLWGCEGPLVIDARLKPHHAPPLTEDPKITAGVDELGKKAGRCTALFSETPLT